MSKIVSVVKRASSVVGGVATAYEIAVSVEGKPLRARTEPASIRVFGLPIFERTEELDRWWFGVIPRGKSRIAKQAIAARLGDK